MLLYVVLTSVLCFTIFVMGVYVLWKDPKNTIHIEFFLIFMIQSFLLGNTIVMQALDNEEQVISLYIYGSALSVLIYYLAVLTSLQLSGIIKLRVLCYILLFIPCIPAAIDISNASSYLEIIYYNHAWRISRFNPETYPYLFFTLYSLYPLIYVFINIKWYIKSDQNKEKKQALVLILTFLLPTVLNMYFGFHDSFKLIKLDIVGASGLIYSIWTIGVFICLFRYRFLAISPQLVGHDMFSAIDEAVILLNANYSIASLNSKAEEILGLSAKNLQGAGMEKILQEGNIVREELDNIKNRLIHDFVCRISFITNAKEKILMDAKCKLVKDKFDDIVGYIIIAKEVKELRQLQYFYKITDREANVIQLVIAGNTNLEIANALDITERTVKAHITNIFNKLVVDNRIQLLILLKDFNLIPEKQADKILFLKNSQYKKRPLK